MSHACHAHGCSRQVPPRMFMCRDHWRRLPRKFKNAIWREYRPGQERSKTPTARYMAVQQMAIGTIAFRPNDEAEAQISGDYVLRAMMFARMAMDDGDGNPLDGLLPAGTEIPTMDQLKTVTA